MKRHEIADLKRRRAEVDEDTAKKVMTMLQRMATAPVSLGFPVLPPLHESDAELRRKAARLRDGSIVPFFPFVDPYELADVVERQILCRQIVNSIVADMRESHAMEEDLWEREEAERREREAAAYHRLKELPERQDPDSETAQYVRQMHRDRREEGQPRRPRKR
jgi:hypothetical protein